jgi:hypothetical protein
MAEISPRAPPVLHTTAERDGQEDVTLRFAQLRNYLKTFLRRHPAESRGPAPPKNLDSGFRREDERVSRYFGIGTGSSAGQDFGAII